jgi:hypothetical protein
MSVHELEGRYNYPKPREKDEPKKASPSRSECTLLWELIQRNPERAKVFLEKLGYSIRQAA